MQLQPIISLNWVDGRGTSRDHLDGDVMVGGAGLRAVNFYRNLFASFQLGLAAGRTDALSSAGQFITTVGWHGSHMVLAVQHISNGRIFGGRNLGETMLMVGYRF